MGLSGVNILNSMGANGCVYVNDTVARTNGTDGFTAIQFTEDSVLSAITGKMDDSADLISDATVFSQGKSSIVQRLVWRWRRVRPSSTRRKRKCPFFR